MVHVVVVDDDRDFTQLVEEILAESDYQVTSCHHEDEAVACVLVEHPDLVLLDVRLIHPDAGWRIFDRLKAHPQSRDIPVVICSAAVDDLRDREEWLEERGTEVLQKPFDVDELLHLIERLVSPSLSNHR